jgi:hypothetical protein
MPSFDSRIHSDALLAHLSSILAMRQLHNVVGEFIMDYTEGPEYNDEETSDGQYSATRMNM